MTDNPYGINHLPYPLSRRTLLEQDDDFLFTQGNPEDAGDCSWFVVQLSNEHRLKFTSALLAGLDQIYPDEFVTLFQLWLQPTEFPNNFPPAQEGCDYVGFCELMIECLQTTPELQQIIQQMGGGYQIPLEQEPVQTIADTDMISDNTGCDNDKLFGAVTGLVDLLNKLAEDFLEILQDNANTVSRIAELIEVIPGVGEVVPADLVTLAENFLEDLLNLYQAAYTEGVRNQFRCDLFCLYKADCNFSISDALDYFADQVTGSFGFDDFNDFIGLYLTGSFTGSSLIAAWNVFCLGILEFGSEALGVTADDMVKMVTAMFNDPDSDWSILCDCSETLVVTFDGSGYEDYTFLTGSLDATFGNPLPSGKYETAGATQTVQAEVNLTSSEITQLKMDAYGNQNRGTIIVEVEDSVGTKTTVFNNLEFFTGWKTFTFNGTWSDIVIVRFRNAVTSGIVDQLWIDNLTIVRDL